MAEFLGLQQPPAKKFRSGTNTNESGTEWKKWRILTLCLAIPGYLDFDFNMHSQYDPSDSTNTQDLFALTNEFNDTLDNTQPQAQPLPPQQQLQQQQQQQGMPASSASTVTSSASNPIVNQQPANMYPGQPRLTYIPHTRGQLTSYQTPNLQRIQTMPATSTIVRPTNVISNGIQQQPTIYTQHSFTQQQQQQMLNRPLYQRMPTATQQQAIPSGLVRQQYNTTTMVNMNQNVPQMSIVKVRTIDGFSLLQLTDNALSFFSLDKWSE